MNTSRLAVSATFTRGMPNFKTTPSRRPVSSEAVVYHAMPHGLRDPLRRRIIPEIVVNTETVQNKKREALGAHRSQKEWLDASQGMDSLLKSDGADGCGSGGALWPVQGCGRMETASAPWV